MNDHLNDQVMNQFALDLNELLDTPNIEARSATEWADLIKGHLEAGDLYTSSVYLMAQYMLEQ